LPDTYRRWLSAGAMLAWAVQLIVVIAGTLAPGDDIPEILSEHDKWVHFGSYVLLGFLPLAAGLTPRRALALAFVPIPLGFLLEIGQNFAPGRSPEFADGLADTAGVAVGVVLGWAFRRLPILRKPPADQ
jgi:VanZ family protein